MKYDNKRRRIALLPLFLLSAALGMPGALVAQESEAPAHHAGDKFDNPYSQREHTGFFNIVRARLSDEWQGYDKKKDIVPTTQPNVADAHNGDYATVTWIGHATLLIQHRGINVLTDPMFSQFASPLSFAGPKRITQPAIDFPDLPDIHAVVISHDHYDHLDTATVKKLGNTPTYFVPLGIKQWMVSKGIDPQRVVELDWWGTRTITQDGEPITITATPAQHFSGRSLWGRDKTLWASWAVEWPDFNVWFGGDTGYNDIQFKAIGDKLGPFDLGIIPIGAYKPRWFMGAIHVNPAEAVLIHKDIRAERSMGIHWGAFILAGEGTLTPPLELAQARRDHDLTVDSFDTFSVGETRRYAVRGENIK